MRKIIWAFGGALSFFALAVSITLLTMPGSGLFALLIGVAVAVVAFLCIVSLKPHQDDLSGPPVGAPVIPPLNNLPPVVGKSIQKRLLPGEHLDVATRHHVIELAGAGVMLFLGIIALVGSTYLWLYHPVLHLRTPKVTYDKTHTVAPQGWHIAVWWLPLVVAIPCLLIAFFVWQSWKWRYVLTTNQRLVEAQLSPGYVFWLGQTFEPVQLRQITDVNDDAGAIARLFGWGTVSYERFPNRTADQTDTVVLRYMPNASAFADHLRMICPLLSGQSQDNPPLGTT